MPLRWVLAGELGELTQREAVLLGEAPTLVEREARRVGAGQCAALLLGEGWHVFHNGPARAGLHLRCQWKNVITPKSPAEAPAPGASAGWT